MYLVPYLVTTATLVVACLAAGSDTADSESKGHPPQLTKNNNKYRLKYSLPQPGKDLQYSFILVRHGTIEGRQMKTPAGGVPPQVKQPLNRRVAKQRKGVMNKVGQALKSRYLESLDDLTWDQIKLTSQDELCATELAYGIFTETKHESYLDDDQVPVVDSDIDFDQHSLLEDGTCSWLNTIMDDMKSKLAKHPLDYCTDELYRSLRGVDRENEANELWSIKSPKEIYDLWNSVMYEIGKGKKIPTEIAEMMNQIQSCVFEYHQILFNWHPDVLPLLVGRMINIIRDEFTDGEVGLHVHVTDDIPLVALNWTLPDNDKQFWPNYGDVLIFDFYKDKTIEVSTYSGLRNTFGTSVTLDLDSITDFVENQHLSLSGEEWVMMCRHQQTSLEVEQNTEEEAPSKKKSMTDSKKVPKSFNIDKKKMILKY